jgi:hypothetical protein
MPIIGARTGFLEGTLRLEAAGQGLRISGDLYRVGPGGASAPLGAIPIQPRAAYACYLKGISVAPSPASATGFDWTFERYVLQNGAFVLERSVSVLLEPGGSPVAGTPAFSASVHGSGGGIISLPEKLLLWRIQDHFREASVEIEAIKGAPIVVQARDPQRQLVDIAGAWNSSRWRMDSFVSRKDIPAGGVAQWAAADLHATMLANRDAVDLDATWRYHILVVPELAPATGGAMIGGIMYDDSVLPDSADPDGVPREGLAIGAKYRFPSQPQFGSAKGKLLQSFPYLQLRVMMHELGHAASLVHTEEEVAGGADEYLMTPTSLVALQGRLIGPDFPKNVRLEFDDLCRRHLMHWPDPVVRPGGLPFPHHISDARNMQQPLDLEQPTDAEPSRNIDIRLEPLDPVAVMGMPVRMRISLTALKTVKSVPSYLDPSLGSATLSVVGPDGTERAMPPLVRAFDGQVDKLLKKGRGRHQVVRLYWSRTGFAFPSPGRHLVRLRLTWTDHDGRHVAEAQTVVLILPPTDRNEALLVRKLMTNDVGRFAALGGADHLPAALESVREACRQNGPLGVSWQLIELERLSRPSHYPVDKRKRRFVLRDIDEATVSRYLAGEAGRSVDCCLMNHLTERGVARSAVLAARTSVRDADPCRKERDDRRLL